MAAETMTTPDPGARAEAATRHTPSPALKRTGDWARRAPLLPALIFTILNAAVLTVRVREENRALRP